MNLDTAVTALLTAAWTVTAVRHWRRPARTRRGRVRHALLPTLGAALSFAATYAYATGALTPTWG